MISFKEYITESKYDYEWDNDNLGYHVTKDGQRVKDAFYKAKSTFDRGEADAAAKKHSVKLRAADITADKQKREHEYQYNKPLSEIEKRWVALQKKLVHSAKTKANYLSDDELKKYSDYGRVVRKSLQDGTHPVLKENNEPKDPALPLHIPPFKPWQKQPIEENWHRAVMRKSGSVKPGHWNGKKFISDLTKQDAPGFDHERCKSINAQVEVNGKVVAGGIQKPEE